MYKINEMFETIQGEGVFTGVPAVFVRLQICPVGCSWCDTKQTWEALPEDETSLGDIMVKTEDSPTWSSIDAQGIVNEYIKQGYTAKHIVITGDEKRAALEKASHLSASEAPIRAVLSGATIHWAQ